MANSTKTIGKAGLVAVGALTVALMLPRPAQASWYIPAGMGHPPVIQPVAGSVQNPPSTVPSKPPASPSPTDPSPTPTPATGSGFPSWGQFPTGVRLPYWYYRSGAVQTPSPSHGSDSTSTGGHSGSGNASGTPGTAGGSGGNGSGTPGTAGGNGGNGGGTPGSTGGNGGSGGGTPGSTGGNGGSGGGAAPVSGAGTLPSGYSYGTSAEVQYVLQHLNALRASQGLGPLSIDPELTRLAQLRLADLANHHVVQHDTPTYGLPVQMERAAGDHWRVMGAENLAANRSVAIAEMALEGEPGHRSNILLPGHNLVGIAVVHNPYGITLDELFAGN